MLSLGKVRLLIHGVDSLLLTCLDVSGVDGSGSAAQGEAETLLHNLNRFNSKLIAATLMVQTLHSKGDADKLLLLDEGMDEARAAGIQLPSVIACGGLDEVSQQGIQ